MAKKLLVAVLLCLLAACEESPTGRRQLALLPDSQLAAMGAEAFAGLKQAQPVETSASINNYVGCVARAVIGVLPEPRGSWEVVVFRNSEPNAFALPGGKIGVNTGMLNIAETPAQLAAVMAHEVGHVIANHANERLTQELGVKSILLMVSLFIGDPGSWSQELLLGALGLGAQVGVLLPFSRTHEHEADIVGLGLMAQAGFDPRQSLALWQNMARASGDQPLEFLSTHPSHQSRFEELQAEMPEALALYQAEQEQDRIPECG